MLARRPRRDASGNVLGAERHGAAHELERDTEFFPGGLGGSGSGGYVFSTSSPGCSIVSSTLSFTGTVVPSTCEVTVVKSAQGAYAASSPSLAQAFTFVAAPQASPLVVSPTRGRFATRVTLTTSGGSGTGATTYVVANGSAQGCALITSNALSTTTAGTCIVQATKAASGIYAASTSSLTSVVVAANLPSAPVLKLLSEHSGVAVFSVALKSLGGDPMTALQYSLNAGPWKSAIRLGHGKIEITSLRRGSNTSVRLRVYTAAGHSPASAPVHVLAK